MRRAMYSVLLAGLFLLMLSALVVTPESVDPELPAHIPPDLHAAFRPLVSAMLPDTADAPAGRMEFRLVLSALPLFSPCPAPSAGARDANGHVLCALRYENSVYQLFRPEVAGG